MKEKKVILDENFLNEIIQSFAKNGRIFSNEAQFQFELAWALKEKLSENVEILLEYLVPDLDNDKKRFIDIMVIKDKEAIPIELKYKTADKEIDYNVGDYTVKTYNQGSYDTGSYDFLKDISRIESIKSIKKIEYKNKEYDVNHGYAIIIANDKRYYSKFDNYDKDKNLYYHNRNGKKQYYYWQNFSLANKRKITGTISWIDPDSGGVDNEGNHTTKDRIASIKLNNTYDLEWKPYNVEGVKDFKGHEFKYMIVEVENQSEKITK